MLSQRAIIITDAFPASAPSQPDVWHKPHQRYPGNPARTGGRRIA
jgi:hypothetical protein